MDSLADDINEIKIDGGAQAGTPTQQTMFAPGPSRAVTLRGLLDAATLNPSVLKRIYRYLCEGESNSTRYSLFLHRWYQVYNTNYGRLQVTINSLYDQLVANSKFEEFLRNTEIDEVAVQQKLDEVITSLCEEYRKSDFLHNGLLEKIVTLLIVREHAQPLFFPMFQFCCSPGQEPRKAWILEALYGLELVGYDEHRDQLLLRDLV